MSKGGGGGDNTFANIHINPYGGAGFVGEMCGIEIIANNSNSFNKIINNTFNMIPSASLQWSGKVSKKLTRGQLVTGQTSGVSGYVDGYNAADSNIVISKTKGKFVQGEKLMQASTGETSSFKMMRGNKTYAIKLDGKGGHNVVANNIIRGLPDYGIYSYSDANHFDNNVIEAINGIFSYPDGIATGNNIYSPNGIAMSTGIGTLYSTNNRIEGGAVKGKIREYLLSTNGVGAAEGFVSNASPSTETTGLIIKNSATNRWAVGKRNPEGLNNSGSDFYLDRFNEAGEYSNTPLSINRGTGAITFDGMVYSNSPLTASGFKLSKVQTAPVSASAPGIAGEIRFTATGIYICIATNTWIKTEASKF